MDEGYGGSHHHHHDDTKTDWSTADEAEYGRTDEDVDSDATDVSNAESSFFGHFGSEGIDFRSDEHLLGPEGSDEVM